MDITVVIQEIEEVFLKVIHEDLARLIYLASTRDYHASRYHHDFLAYHYSDEMVDQALAACHRQVFERLAVTPLAEIVRQLESYLRSAVAPPANALHLWNRLAPYRVLPPGDCEPLTAELFLSNIKVALAVLNARHQAAVGADDQVSS